MKHLCGVVHFFLDIKRNDNWLLICDEKQMQEVRNVSREFAVLHFWSDSEN